LRCHQFASSTRKKIPLSARCRRKQEKNEKTLGEEVDEGGGAGCVGLAVHGSTGGKMRRWWTKAKEEKRK
jgi:hypothetical protein